VAWKMYGTGPGYKARERRSATPNCGGGGWWVWFVGFGSPRRKAGEESRKAQKGANTVGLGPPGRWLNPMVRREREKEKAAYGPPEHSHQ